MKVKIIDMAAIIAAIAVMIEMPYLYIIGVAWAQYVAQVLWIIPVEPIVTVVPYGTTQPMLYSIYLLIIAGILGIVSVFATICEGLKDPAHNTPRGVVTMRFPPYKLDL